MSYLSVFSWSQRVTPFKLHDQKLTHLLGHEISDAKKHNALRRFKL